MEYTLIMKNDLIVPLIQRNYRCTVTNKIINFMNDAL